MAAVTFANQANGDVNTMPIKSIRTIALRGITLAAVAVILSGCIDCPPPGDPNRPIYPTFCRNFRSAQRVNIPQSGFAGISDPEAFESVKKLSEWGNDGGTCRSAPDQNGPGSRTASTVLSNLPG
jgi:hypothetical protein